MAFTIQIKKQDGDFSIEDVKMRHKECGGGIIKVDLSSADRHEQYSYVTIQCKRCKTDVPISTSEYGTGALMLTSFDGEEREINLYFDIYSSPRPATRPTVRAEQVL